MLDHDQQSPLAHLPLASMHPKFRINEIPPISSGLLIGGWDGFGIRLELLLRIGNPSYGPLLGRIENPSYQA
jgi:hypothetical protein